MKKLLVGALMLAGFLAGQAHAGQLSRQVFDSPALNGQIPAMVYVPEGPAPAAGWPVLYLLHGHDGNERSWTDLGHIQTTLDGLIARGEIAKLMVVMPGGGNGWYVDSEDVGGPGDFETAITRDLVRAIEAAYPVRRDRGGRSIAGLSMGGFGALRLALGHPERYVSVASLSGAIWQNIPAEEFGATPERIAEFERAEYFHRVDPQTVTVGRILPSVISHFGGAFGRPFDPRRFNQQNIFTLLEKQRQAGATLPAMYITCGDDDSLNLWQGAISFYNTAKADRIKDVQLRITDGGHVWSLWAAEIVDVLHFVDGKWTTPPAKPVMEPAPPMAERDQPRRSSPL
ncbi:alpha/beta hydrolase [Rhodospirillum rubrum]|uniref:Esterase n=1 Tax=Rhodospirillum rubrum (strain ATCC 11170 / ATH 1.1.1 / DSM 467 / LMG 4362 / NCIMB 8255 / S1) TaxID=269796 RepID=Q2RXP3_RHORT|nr:alpha/beta hydrolase family protein [Rhodospirillum rubrum]ABC21102.1 Putative esterase [Rhodospirillum rubrum ATCC 11170]AEO46770.1 putative esterase [Rhodospirillum rubrum F11]MBK5952650.1 esterase family protein [Rhodospirillum rubrum]QXG80794.1 esterase family protein [Rhodospirillum rubrum]HAQ00805.1 esterase family protein [Rhodospirillum rubrum]